VTGRAVNETRRRRYLDAMGVRVWRLRDGFNAPPGEEPAEREVAREAYQALDVSLAEVSARMGDASAVLGDGADAGFEHESPDVRVASVSDLQTTEATETKDKAAEAGCDGVAVMGWDALHEAVAGCRACALCETRTQTVFGVGDTDADLMIVGEAPGADEDRQGEPFVGKAGQLLNLMLASIGLNRSQVYIANILKCRPPGNRNPRQEEAVTCRVFLMRQIALVQPRVILSVGGVSAHNLLDTNEAVGRLRGRWFDFGTSSMPLTVTYHPSYLLRSPEQKAKAWEDLQRVARRLRGD